MWDDLIKISTSIRRDHTSLFFVRHSTRVALFGLAFLVNSTVSALEALDENEMRNRSGEGIAAVPENFYIKFDDDASINLAPVGPVSNNLNPLDAYFYGLSLGRSTTTTAGWSWNHRGVSPITSWGTASNPFVLKAWTPQANEFMTYSGISADGYSTSVLSFELPEYLPNVETTPENGSDAYTLKFAGAVDFLSRKTSDSSLDSDTFNSDGGRYNNRLRGQFVVDGFSLNGTKVNMFKTSNDLASTNQRNGLGLSLLLRINSASTGYFRMSTAVVNDDTSNGQNVKTSARGGVIPNFNGKLDGLMFQNLDINVPIGQLHYQPLTLSLAPDGRNIVLELARIPNIASVYNRYYYGLTYQPANIYQAELAVANVTCNASQCGSATVPATHGSLSNDALYFVNHDNTGAVDVGKGLIDGVSIQHLKITTTGL